jgi:hypothetical protein
MSWCIYLFNPSVKVLYFKTTAPIPHQPSLKSTVSDCRLDFSRKWVMINVKYLSADNFLIWSNAKIYRYHFYKYSLNIRTMLEGLERFWWAGDIWLLACSSGSIPRLSLVWHSLVVIFGSKQHLHYDGHVIQILSPDWPVVFVYSK